jgi:hypothetical protein
MNVTRRAQQLYETQVKNLPIAERLQLIKLVIDDLSNVVTQQEGEDEEWTALSLESFHQEWDNPEDAVYDNWQEAYGVSTG